MKRKRSSSSSNFNLCGSGNMENSNLTNNNGGLSSTTSISDLLDNQLIEIFVRLPSYKAVITSKFVSKRWLSLLSNPKFVIQFVNHKKKQKKDLPWTFLPLCPVKLTNDDSNKTAKSFIKIHNKVFYNNSPKFSLKFLPIENFGITATFKDLVLCLDLSRNDHRYYYMCNPVTNRWVALPPTPSPPVKYDNFYDYAWSGLTCEDPYDSHNNNNNNIDDYRFRVVVIPYPVLQLSQLRPQHNPFITVSMSVFCSDNSKWIDIVVRVPLNPNRTEGVKPLKAVICKGMVCVCYGLFFGMFNPFDVTPTTESGTTVTARGLPVPPMFSRSNLLECGGKLITVLPTPLAPTYHKDKEGNLLVDYKAGIELRMLYSELDLNQVADDYHHHNGNEVEVCWNGFNRDKCVDKTGTLHSVFSGIRMINIHPRNNQLLYMLTATNELLLWDRRSSALKILGRCESFPDHLLHPTTYRRIELQYWPTPLPNISLRCDTS